MATFEYTAVDSSGKSIKGRIEADSREAALRQVSRQGHFPIDAVARDGAASGGGGATSFSLFSGKPSATDITLFTRELSLLLSAGQPLAGTLALLEGDSSTQRIRNLARRLRIAISSGKSLDEALALENGCFPPIYVGMVKAAEASGQLESVLERIADTREREQKLNSKIVSALIYPSILIVTAISAVLLLRILVVPRYKDMLGDQVGRLPANSQAVLYASDWLNANAQGLAIGSACALLIALLISQYQPVQAAWQRFLLRVPLIGTLIRMALAVRFCRTLGVLLTAGLGLPAELALTRDVIGNSSASALIDRISAALREGTDFTVPMSKSGVFPSMVSSLLKIGAESGSLASSSLRLADMYENKLEIAMQRVVTMLEPAIILVVSLFIGFIVLSIVGAIMSVYDLTGS